MTALYTTLIYQPLYNALIWFYNILPNHDIGLAIIAITILIRLILYPLTQSSLKSQRALQTLQPKIKDLQERFKNDKETLAKEMMLLYKLEKVHPLSSCLPLLLQLPVLFAVYHVFQRGISSEGFNLLYSFVQNPGSINHISFGFLDVTKSAWYLAVAAGVAQFFQTKMMIQTQPPKVVAKAEASKDEAMMAAMNKQMMYMMPIMTIVIAWNLPSGLALYWFLSTLLMFLQQIIIFRSKKPTEIEIIRDTK